MKPTRTPIPWFNHAVIAFLVSIELKLSALQYHQMDRPALAVAAHIGNIVVGLWASVAVVIWLCSPKRNGL